MKKIPILIFSVYRSNNPEDNNDDNHACVIQKLKQLKINHKELEMHVNGSYRKAILLPTKYKTDVVKLCKQFNQPSYIESDMDRLTEIVMINNNSRIIAGTIIHANKYEAQESNLYFYDPSYDYYYRVKKWSTKLF